MTKHKALTINGHRINLTLEISKPTAEQVNTLAENLDKMNETIKAQMLDSFKDLPIYEWHAALKSFLDTKNDELMKHFRDELLFQKTLNLVGSYSSDNKSLYVSNVDENDGLEELKTDIRNIVEWTKNAKTVTK